MIRFNKSNLTNKEKRETQLVIREGRGKLIASVIFYAMLFGVFSFHFEVKLLNILSSSSMLDESDTLSTFDRIFIKRKADKLYENFGLPFRFYITTSPPVLPKSNTNSLYIALQYKTDNSIVHFPPALATYQAQVDYYFRSCVHTENKSEKPDYAKCIEESLVLLNNNMENTGFKKIQPNGFNLFQPQQEFK